MASTTSTTTPTTSSQIEQFDLSYKNSSFSQREVHFRALVHHHNSSNTGEGRLWLTEYLRRFPFNTQMWNTFAQHMKHESIEAAEQIFSAGVVSNPRSYELWYTYLSFVRSEQLADELKTTQLFQKAVESIGYDYNSSIYWEDLIRLQNENKLATYKLFQRCLKIPTKNFDDILEKFAMFFTYCNPEEVAACWTVAFPSDPNNSSAFTTEEMIEKMKAQLNEVALKTKSILPQVTAFESQLSVTEYLGSGNKDERDVWQKYFNFAKEQLCREHVNFLFEKALIPNCDKEGMWQQYLLYLDEQSFTSEGKHAAHALCARFAEFFKNLTSEAISFQVAEINELSGEIDASREIYAKIINERDEKSQGYLRVMNRWIQFEKRVNSSFESIVKLYNKVLEGEAFSVEIKSWIIDQLARWYASNGKKSEGLVKFITFFESHPATRSSFSSLLSYVSDEFQSEPAFIDIVADISQQATTAASATEVQFVATLAISQIRQICRDIEGVRKLEKEIRDAEKAPRQAAASASDEQSEVVKESLLKKRSLASVIGEVDGDLLQKHFKSE